MKVHSKCMKISLKEMDLAENCSRHSLVAYLLNIYIPC